MAHTSMFQRLLRYLPLALWFGITPATGGQATLLVWGDSLSAAHGIAREQGWVALLRKRLAPRAIEVVNGSVSGETSSGGLARLPEALARLRPRVVVLELGANDGLRGQSLARLKSNLEAMIELAQQAGARVVLVGMKLPPNYGPAYTGRFSAIYTQLAENRHLPLVPFLLAGVADDFELMQADGLHPTAAAQPRILDNAWPAIEQALEAPAAAEKR